MPQYTIVGYSKTGYLIGCDQCGVVRNSESKEFKCPTCEPKPKRGRKPKEEATT